METEMFDPARSSVRGCTVHGHSLRLNENGMMFDMLQRCVLDKDGKVKQVKDQVGDPLDRKVDLGKPMTEAELKKRTSIYRVDGVAFRSDDEVVGWVQRITMLRTKYGFSPK
jgi:methyl-coenzyme M reductase gamma subunit